VKVKLVLNLLKIESVLHPTEEFLYPNNSIAKESVYVYGTTYREAVYLTIKLITISWLHHYVSCLTSFVINSDENNVTLTTCALF